MFLLVSIFFSASRQTFHFQRMSNCYHLFKSATKLNLKTGDKLEFLFGKIVHINKQFTTIKNIHRLYPFKRGEGKEVN